MINLTTLKNVLQSARPVPIYPLNILIENKLIGTQTRIATNYASFGISAQASHLMEKTSHQRSDNGFLGPIKQVLMEVSDVFVALKHAQPFMTGLDKQTRESSNSMRESL